MQKGPFSWEKVEFAWESCKKYAFIKPTFAVKNIRIV